ncbi:MAG: hypothetical protein WA964_03065, partial [Ilumatobacter sp.]
MKRVGPVHLLATFAFTLGGLAVGSGGEVGARVEIDDTPDVVVAGDDSAARFDITHNLERDEFFAVWEDTGFTPTVPGSSTGAILGQRLSADGSPLGAPIVVAVGPPGSSDALARPFAPPKAAYNTATDEYLVVFARAAPGPQARTFVTTGRLVSDEGVLVGSEVPLNPPLGNFPACAPFYPEVVADPGTGGYVLAYDLAWGTTTTNPAWECGGFEASESRTIIQALDGSLVRGPRVSFPTSNEATRVRPKIAHNPVTGQIMVTQPFEGRVRAFEGRNERSFEAQIYSSSLTPVGPMLTIDVDPTDEGNSQPVNQAHPIVDPASGNWFIVSAGSVIGTVWTNLLDPSGGSLRDGTSYGTGGVNKVSAVGDGRFVVSANGGGIHHLRDDGTRIHTRTSPIRGRSESSQVATVGPDGNGVGFGLFENDTAAIGFQVVAPGALPVPPARLLETRTNDGLTTVDGEALGDGPVTGGQLKVLQVAGRGGVPDDARAVNLNVTSAGASAGGFVTVFPCDADQPNTSNLNYAAGGAASAAAFARLSAAGTVCLFTSVTA